jgi:UDP:flavonoid glycosyltransferase YjiC (YdhE family)
MKITILTFGTRGDIEPYLALAVGLQRAGHRTAMVASQRYAEWIRSYGVEPRPLRFDMTGLMNAGGYRAIRQELSQGIVQASEDYLGASQDADFLVKAGVAGAGAEIAEAFGIPMAFSYPSPYTPTRAFPSFWLPWRRSWGEDYNLLTHKMCLGMMWWGYGPPLNRWRAEHLGLPPWRSYAEMLHSRRRFETPVLMSYSPAMVPPVPDWDAGQHATGYWFLDPPLDWRPPAAVLQFLEDGPPPVFVGFGSTRSKNPQRLTRELLRALESTGQRGILAVGQLVRLPAPPNVLYVDEIPYGWLFPRMAAVVHHGGAGTTAAVVRAGVPNIISPLALEQFAWGERVEALGIGLRMPRIGALRAASLAAAIRTALGDAEMRARAAAFGEKIRAENGIAAAVDVIERHAERFRELQRSTAKVPATAALDKK